MIYIFFMLFIDWCSADGITKLLNKTDNILCRGCGTQILKSDTIISKLSDASLYSFNDTLFDGKEILVQVLVRDLFLRHPVITASDSSCIEKEDWEEDDLWFPGYVVKPCFCPVCGDFIGWMFQNENPKIVHSTDKFYGIILTNIIGENFFKSLITYPDRLI